MSQKKREEPKREKTKKSLISQLLGKGKATKEELKLRLSKYNLQQLATITQLVVMGTLVVGSYTVDLVVWALEKYAKMKDTVIGVVLDGEQVGKVSPDMPEEEQKKLAVMLTKYVKPGTVLRYEDEKQSGSEITNRSLEDRDQVQQLKDEIKELERQLEELKK